MKTLKIGAFAILGLLAVACSDDDENTAKLTSQEQAEMVASAMGESGFSQSAEQAGNYADNNDARVNAECGVEVSNDWDLEGSWGEGITWMYNSDFRLLLNCSGDEPESLDVDFDYTGNYVGPRFESSYAGEGDMTISGLNNDDDNFELNGSYDREGSFEVKENGQVTEEGSHDLDIQAEDVLISKSTHHIVSGKASVDAEGNIEGRGSYSFKAEVTFSGTGSSRKATIKVAGDTYDLNIESNTLVQVNN